MYCSSDARNRSTDRVEMWLRAALHSTRMKVASPAVSSPQLTSVTDHGPTPPHPNATNSIRSLACLPEKSLAAQRQAEGDGRIRMDTGSGRKAMAPCKHKRALGWRIDIVEYMQRS
ncbi:hypothetical protein MPTK1_1g03030 [Marchantia polymorpha subsp. ruderalis]|uniref:Uncharacterized protein n=2 Tax=Marchantia polymorpha TaxID=3197 RepID=A0AAF6AKY2_MARPO|nr:hypothetical protein MARPO_0113s0051 [Marchantia polymorpha]BBM97102.1 hypothetical protein Mp_1g03030 [Marchantia polymorpha subsp. ruderalis]|eukprot:PTQ31325.1 hypothetical protein MARPO_0113s0051 [Marchantia polymorpha]